MKFCAACGAAVLPGTVLRSLRSAGRGCRCASSARSCRAPATAPPAAPAAVPPVPVVSEYLPPLRPARSTVNVGAVVVGLLAVALIAGGVVLVLRDDPADGAAAAVTVASNTTIADTSTSTIADTSTTAVDLACGTTRRHV